MEYFNRDRCHALLTQYTQNTSLLKHAYAVEIAMRAYAEHVGEDPEVWGAAGLLHDFDYERYPSLEDHPFRGAEILRAEGYPEEFVEAILGHAQHTQIPRRTPMAKTLFAVDELSGFIVACALVQPDKQLAQVKPKSVKKKLKDKAFAKSVSREDIRLGSEELGVDLLEHITFVCSALTANADRLGL